MMTLFRNARRRLRRYALFCLVAGATATNLPSPTSSAEDCFYFSDTYESEALCGWCDECPDLPLTAPPSDALAAETEEKPSDETDQNFIAVLEGDLLDFNTCNYDEWLASVEIPEPIDATPATKSDPVVSCDRSYDRTRIPVRRTELDFNSTLATLAASVGTGNPVSFGHWTEPFAMVGPNGSHLPEQIQEFELWVQRSFESAHEEVKTSLQRTVASSAIAEFIPFVDFDGVVDGLAENAPVEAEKGSLALVETTTTADRIRSRMRKQLIGSSPVIVTMEEAETDPIDDMIALQEALWPVALETSHDDPISVRPLEIPGELNWSPLAKNTDNRSGRSKEDGETQLPAKVEKRRVKPSVILSGISDRMLATMELGLTTANRAQQQVAQRAETLLAESLSEANHWIESQPISVSPRSARQLGASIASIAESGYRWVDSFTDDLARQVIAAKPQAPIKQQAKKKVPSEIKPRVPKKGAGERLIARAEAVPRRLAESNDETNSAESVSDEQLAEAIAQVWQWVDVARNALDSFQIHLQDVTEVARNRGTQDDSRRR